MIGKLSHLHVTIGLKILLGFGVVLSLVLIQALAGNLGFDRAVDDFTRYGETNRGVRGILSLERNVLDLQRGVLAHTYSGYGGLADRVRDLREILSGQMREARSRETDPAKARLLEQMADQLGLYAGHFDSAIRERGQRDALAFENLEAVGDDALEGLDGLRVALLDRNDGLGAALVSHARTQLALVQRDALRYLLKPNSRLARETRARLAALSESLERLLDHWGDRPDRDAVVRLRDLTAGLDEAFNGMVQATRAYLHLVYVVMGGEASRIGWLAQKLKDLSLQDQAAVETGMAATVHDSQRIIQGVSLLALTLGFLLAWRIGRGISLPIQAMTRTLSGLARGRMDWEIPGTGRNDEIGAMAMAAHVFKEKAHELENASRYKSEFLANMSHELRTPLNSMLILSRVLANNETGNLTPGQVESAQVVHESGTDLLRLINDILDLSKVEAGRMDVHAEERDFSGFRRTLERLFQPVAEQKGLTFAVEIHPEAPAMLNTDWAKVEQIVRNFLSNAFKFTARGGVRVTVAPPRPGHLFMHPGLSSRNCVAVAVQDSGIGIPEDKREQIFEAFRQVDGTTSRQYGGTGLGLSISRRFAELVGGEIQVESEEGQGSAFTLYLPHLFPETIRAEKGAGGVIPGKDANATGSAFAFKALSRTVLVVDDDRRNVFALKQALDGHVGRVLSAGNGRQALAVLDEHPDVDLVLMDIMMPDMDGYQAMEAIRRQTRFSRLPILALTAKAMPGDREKCLEAGASDYLAKPVDADRLLRALAEWLDRPKAPVMAEPVHRNGETTLPKVRILADDDPDKAAQGLPSMRLGDPPATVLIVDDDMRNTFALARALQETAGRVLLARDGRKALAQLEKEKDVRIVLMDVMMPDMDGYEAMREIRRRENLRHLPVIALTAKAMPGDREKCLEAGADDYLCKPVELDRLLEKMRHWLDVRPRGGGVETTTEGKETTP